MLHKFLVCIAHAEEKGKEREAGERNPPAEQALPIAAPVRHGRGGHCGRERVRAVGKRPTSDPPAAPEGLEEEVVGMVAAMVALEERAAATAATADRADELVAAGKVV